MSVYFPAHQTEPPVHPPRRKLPFWLGAGLALAVGGALGLGALPGLLPTLAASLAGPLPPGYWYLSRASAFVAFVLLWLSMLAGLGITNRLAHTWPGMPGAFALHRAAGLLGLVFALGHALLLLGDRYINYTLDALLVPFMAAGYRPQWVGLGQVAFYVLGVVALSFYVRDRLGVRAWRLIHALSFALFLAVLIHGLYSGTDSRNWWAVGLYGMSATSVLFAAVYRVLAARIGVRAPARLASGLIAAGGNAPARHTRAVAGPQRSSPAGRCGIAVAPEKRPANPMDR